MRKASAPRQPRPLRITAALLTAASAILWGVAIAGIWAYEPAAAASLDRTAAATTAILSALYWLADGLRRSDTGRGVLIDTVANLTRPASRRTGPLRRVQ